MMQGGGSYLRDRFIERVILLTLLVFLVFACLQIVQPFLGAILWGIIIAVSTWPLYEWLRERLHGRKKLAAALLATALLLVLVVPVTMLVSSLAEGTAAVAALLTELTRVRLPPPPDWMETIPVIGGTLDERWREAMEDLPKALARLQPYIGTAASYALAWGTHLGFAVLEFMIATVFAGILYVTGETAMHMLRRFVIRIGGAHHLGLIDVATQTIRGVAAGVIGTAFLQAVLLVFGLVVVEAPGPIVLGFLTFFLLVIQLPNFLVWVPVVIWLTYRGETAYAAFLFIWGFFVVSTIDNFVRPYLISQGAKLPLLLIFIGVIGGLLAYGFIGLFIGATLLGVGYTLFRSWLDEDLPEPTPMG